MTREHPLARKWNQRYTESTDAGTPAAVLLHCAHLLPARGEALDLACGLGANARFLAQRGLHCTGWDISQVALDQLARWRGDDGAQVYTQLRDVEAEPPAPASFDVIVVSDFLHRPLCNALSAALRPGGLLFYQTWCADKCVTAGPSNPDFLLQTNELPSLFTGLEIRFYQHFSRAGDLTLGDRDRACLVAQQPG